MQKILLFTYLIFFQISVFAAGTSLISTISITGYSAIEPDGSTVYGGIAGTACTGDGTATCNSCTDTTTLQACNLNSVYSTQQITVAFTMSQDLTTASVAKFYIENAAGVAEQVGANLPLAAGTKTGSFTTTWSQICQRSAGSVLNSSCVGGTTALVVAKNIALGVDSNANGDVETDERKTIAFKLHYIPPNTVVNQSYCPTTAAGFGVCNLKILAGDEKAFIDSAITNGIDSSVSGGSIDWDSLVAFPIEVPNDTLSDSAAYSGFKSGNRPISPIVRAISATGDIPDSQLSGNLKNYVRYCFVYANKNKAQNIYRFVTDPLAAPTGCVTLSENVGILEDKHCFISTAAFGSDMAAEVQTFRKFRNQFLLTSDLGKLFVKAYYKFSPPAANFISQNETLRGITRAALYPFLGFSYIALNYGILAALLTLIVLFILIFRIKQVVKQKTLLFFLIVMILAPTLKAQVEPDTTVIQHPDAVNGLIKITKDGTYIYDVKRDLKNQSGRISFGEAMNPEITIDIEQTNTSGQPSGTFKTFGFDDFYEGASKFIISYDYEYFPWINKGKLGIQGGVSLMYAQGHGRQKATLQLSEEKYTFFTLPLTLGAVYRFEYKDKQMFAPYVAGGGTYTVLVEKREDKSNLHYTAAPGFYGAGGMLINLSLLDEESGFALDSEYGITNLWISVEFRAVEVDSDSFKYSAKYLNAGLSFDF